MLGHREWIAISALPIPRPSTVFGRRDWIPISALPILPRTAKFTALGCRLFSSRLSDKKYNASQTFAGQNDHEVLTKVLLLLHFVHIFNTNIQESNKIGEEPQLPPLKLPQVLYLFVG